MEPQHYKNYIGSYVKRFYQPFRKDNIYLIIDFRERAYENGMIIPEFLCTKGDRDQNWFDCE